MSPLDGHYRHRGASIIWDDSGVTLTRLDEPAPSTASWPEIVGARQIGERPGFVQILVRDHVPPADPRHDPFSLPVNSDPDANRLVTSITWRAAAEKAASGDDGESGRSSRRRSRAPRT